VRYEDDDVDRPRSRRAQDHPTTAGMIGFIAAMVSLGLLAVVLVLYIFLRQEEQQQPNLQRERWMYYWFLILDAVAFFSGLIATILCARGLSPSNPLYRGWAIFGMILGILEIVTTIGLSLVWTCMVLMVEINRARPGG